MHVFERFGWFLQELFKSAEQELEVSEIQRNTPDDCEVDKVDEYYRNAPECFTEDSYDKYTTETTLQWLKTPAGKKRMEELLGKGKKKNVQDQRQALAQGIH